MTASKRKKLQEYRSYEEYRKAFYPSATKTQPPDGKDAFSFGAFLARESLSKLDHLLKQKNQPPE